MALTLFEELQLIDGAIEPTGGFERLIYQSAVGFSATFLPNSKTTTGDDLATAYLNKMVSVCNRINRKTSIGNDVDALKKIFISFIGDQYTYAQVQGATDAQWEGFISGQIDEVLEIAGGVIKAEKDAYTAL